MRKATAVALAGVLGLAAAAMAFEFTYWNGPEVACVVKAKVKKGARANEAVVGPATLQTQQSTFDLTWQGGPTLPGLMEKRNDRNYRASADPESAAFLQWVHDKVLAATGIDVNVVGASLKGKFVLNGDFSAVKVGDKIKFFGTVATGEDAGKEVKGSIKIKGVMDRSE